MIRFWSDVKIRRNNICKKNISICITQNIEEIRKGYNNNIMCIISEKCQDQNKLKIFRNEENITNVGHHYCIVGCQPNINNDILPDVIVF